MSNIPQFIKDVYEANKVTNYYGIIKDKVVGSKLGIVSLNEDPLDYRRIKVKFAETPELDSYWIMRSPTSHDFDYPVPRLGSTVRVEFIDGDITKGFYSVVANSINVPHETRQPLDDYSIKLSGDYLLDSQLEIRQKAGEQIVINSNDGSTITLKPSGEITIVSKSKVSIKTPIVLIDADQTTITGNLAVEGVSTIKGKPATVLGAIDVAGHPLVSTGY